MVRIAGVIVVVLVAVVAAAEQPAAEQTPACSTAIVATGCDHKPVEGVPVKIVTSQGWAVKGETNAQGRAEFDLCVEDITKLKVGGLRSDKVSFGRVVEESEGKHLATITVGMCVS